MTKIAHILRTKYEYSGEWYWENPFLAYFVPEKSTETALYYQAGLDWPTYQTVSPDCYELIENLGEVPHENKRRRTEEESDERIAFDDRVYLYYQQKYALPNCVDYNFERYSGWIAPDGKFYSGSSMGCHTGIAEMIVAVLYPEDKSDGYMFNAETAVIKRGYVRVSELVINFNSDNMKPSVQQLVSIVKTYVSRKNNDWLRESFTRSLWYFVEDYGFQDEFTELLNSEEIFNAG